MVLRHCASLRTWRSVLCVLVLLASAARWAPAQTQTPAPAPCPAQTDVSVALVLAVDTSFSVKDEASANAFADAIAGAPRQLFRGGTSISGAIDYARDLLAHSPLQGARRIIDISGDGSNNSGRPVTVARDEAVADGVIINGLPILTVEPGLDRYYYDNVIGGPDAFMIPAANYDNFADAILKKLLNEIAAEPGRHQIVTKTPSQTRPSLRTGFWQTGGVQFSRPNATIR
jgi:Protein of unknown function (DUF1194)